MSDTYKPFACPEPNCGQSFASEDRLNAHIILHESMTSTLRLLAIPSSCLADQTPTPTRFLRNCDEIGLFQEINPFDKDFKKAIEQQNNSTSVETETDPVQATPLFVFKGSTDEIAENCDYNTTCDDVTAFSVTTTSDDITAVSDMTPVSDDITAVCHDAHNSVSHDVEALTTATDTATAQLPHIPCVMSSGLTVQVMLKLPNGQSIPVNIPAELIIPAITSVTPGVAIDNTNLSVHTPVGQAASPSRLVVTPLSIQTSASAITHNVLQDFATVATISQVAAPLPTVVTETPVSVAMSPVTRQPFTSISSQKPAAVSKVPLYPTTSTSSSSETPHCGLTALGIAASTREKLKAAVQTMQQRPSTMQQKSTNSLRRLPVEQSTVSNKIPRLSLSAASTTVIGIVSPVAMATSAPINPVAMATSTEGIVTPLLSVDPDVDLSRVQFEAADTSSCSSTHQQTWSSKSSSDDDNSDRRKRFLESNRAAANRCRQKKKQWVTNLEAKANDLEKINQNLEKEMRSLKREIHQLKLMLLQHKDCPAMSNVLFTIQPDNNNIS